LADWPPKGTISKQAGRLFNKGLYPNLFVLLCASSWQFPSSLPFPSSVNIRAFSGFSVANRFLLAAIPVVAAVFVTVFPGFHSCYPFC
jgi:hypothetical protein